MRTLYANASHGAAEAAVAGEAEGLRLHLSRSNSTGYRGVRKERRRFRAQRKVDGKSVALGCFDTAVEAAVAYARMVGEAPVAAEAEAEAVPEPVAAEAEAEAEEAAAAAPAEEERKPSGSVVTFATAVGMAGLSPSTAYMLKPAAAAAKAGLAVWPAAPEPPAPAPREAAPEEELQAA